MKPLESEPLTYSSRAFQWHLKAMAGVLWFGKYQHDDKTLQNKPPFLIGRTALVWGLFC